MSKLRTANLLGALACEVADRLRRDLRHHPNETDSAAAALNIIGFYQGCSNARLSRALRLSHPATVRLVDKLELAGLVESRTGDDRRSVSLHLTSAGKSRLSQILSERCAALEEVIGGLTRAERRQLDALAERLLHKLTTSTDAADYICRLCDEIACPPDRCPVHQTALAFEAA
jgi:DNA-binding MarR family transcriptional regulator